MARARVLAFSATTSSSRPGDEMRELLSALINKLQILVLIAPWSIFTINRLVDRLMELLHR